MNVETLELSNTITRQDLGGKRLGKSDACMREPEKTPFKGIA